MNHAAVRLDLTACAPEQTELDDFIEISFSVSPQVRRLALHDVDGLSIEDPHWSWKSPTADGYPADKPGLSCAVLSAG